jgi:hypothetical protein
MATTAGQCFYMGPYGKNEKKGIHLTYAETRYLIETILNMSNR